MPVNGKGSSRASQLKRRGRRGNDVVADRKNVSVLVLFMTFMVSLPALPTEVHYVINYDLRLTIGEERVQTNGKGRVFLDRPIPLVSPDYKVELSLTDYDDSSFTAELTLYEATQDGWVQLVPETPQYESPIGSPQEYTWKTGEIELNLALVIGKVEL